MPVTNDNDEPQPVTAEHPAAPEPQPLILLSTPRDGVPPVVSDLDALADTVRVFAAGTGPVAVDAERASGHRYGQRAFLVQLRREGAGTALIDPAALPDLSSLGDALAGAEWIVHAASQDLACLAEVGMRPSSLFDTELGSRLAGFSRVGLAAVVEQLLGLGLAKEHSAVDWSTRPLPEPWLRYAALDVEVLVDLRNALAEELERQNKTEWARQEFAAVAAATGPAPRTDPWRRTSGLHRVRTRRQLAVVRSLWLTRDAMAQDQDVAPGRIMPDTSLVEAALALPASPQELAALTTFTGRGSRRHLAEWFQAIRQALAEPEADLPPLHVPVEGPPPARVWAERDPVAAARLVRARAALAEIAARHHLPVENLVSPDTVRRLTWTPPEPADEAAVEAFLTAQGARPWQRELTVRALAGALAPPD